ncbi:Agp3p [Sugiyamaella lignohabitans]|uniref:Agp3p n=1 Tax=Sugiyamaella lignohabitans TaxID=796027 RepID=A0A167CYA1_9ASCO|nr:Agp3p [Sugiyamaella lignohabitans]ANB12251.1 Agp3p [Sugiyamaella lignohabitans]
MGLSFFQGIICPSNSPELLTAGSVTASSPFTIGFVLAGWKSAGQLVNTLTLIAFISAGNGVVYVQSRTLYAMALKGRAPKFFSATTTRGVPYRAILFSNLFGFLALMNLKVSAGSVFNYLCTVGGTAAYIAWATMVFTFLRIRKGAAKQGISIKTFPFKAWGPIGLYWFAFVFFIFLLFVQGFASFLHPFDWRLFISSYITIPTFLILFFGFKWANKTKFVRTDQMDFKNRRQWIEDIEDVADSRPFTRKLADLVKR